MSLTKVKNGRRIDVDSEQQAALEAEWSRVPPATNAATNAERDRRIAQGVSINTSAGQTVPVDTRNDTDFRNIAGLVQSAALRVMSGHPPATLQFRGSDDRIYDLTDQEIIELGEQVRDHVERHYKASWAVKAQIEAGTLTDADNIPWALDAALA